MFWKSAQPEVEETHPDADAGAGRGGSTAGVMQVHLGRRRRGNAVTRGETENPDGFINGIIYE